MSVIEIQTVFGLKMDSGVPAGGLAFRAGMVYTGRDRQIGKDLFAYEWNYGNCLLLQ